MTISLLTEPHTHPVKPTLSFNEASPLARALWMEMRDVCQNGEAYWIAEKYLDLARLEGPRDAEA